LYSLAAAGYARFPGWSSGADSCLDRLAKVGRPDGPEPDGEAVPDGVMLPAVVDKVDGDAEFGADLVGVQAASSPVNPNPPAVTSKARRLTSGFASFIALHLPSGSR
jgi:hypothetical protein